MAVGDFRLRVSVRVRVRVTLRLAVYRQSVRLGAEPLETQSQIFFSQLHTCDHSPYIRATFSLTRGWVCHLQLLLALARAFIIGSESRGTRDHILLSQIRDFHFRRLQRLAGLRWMYSTTAPHRKNFAPLITSRHRPTETQLIYCCLRVCWGPHVINTQPVNWCAGCCVEKRLLSHCLFPGFCLATGLYVTVLSYKLITLDRV
jgi:hypothetical protein